MTSSGNSQGSRSNVGEAAFVRSYPWLELLTAMKFAGPGGLVYVDRDCVITLEGTQIAVSTY